MSAQKDSMTELSDAALTVLLNGFYPFMNDPRRSKALFEMMRLSRTLLSMALVDHSPADREDFLKSFVSQVTANADAAAEKLRRSPSSFSGVKQ